MIVNPDSKTIICASMSDNVGNCTFFCNSYHHDKELCYENNSLLKAYLLETQVSEATIKILVQ